LFSIFSGNVGWSRFFRIKEGNYDSAPAAGSLFFHELKDGFPIFGSLQKVVTGWKE
jgi:hypothetical protein